jgi:hypothetical protein
VVKHVVSRRELGDRLVVKREYFPTEVANLKRALARRPLLDTMLTGLPDRASSTLGYTSWFAPQSRLMLDCVRLQAQATWGSCVVAAAPAGRTVPVTLLGAVVSVKREDRAEIRPLTEWTQGWGAALAARDEASIRGLRGVPDDLHRKSSAQIDAYQYPLKEALVSVISDRDRCLAAVERARDQWKQRTIARKSGAEIDAALMDTIEALAKAQPEPFNEALERALAAHAKHWGKGDNHLSASGWVAIRHLGLACAAHDRGIPIEVESDYLPRSLIELRFTSELSLESPPSADAGSAADPAARAREQTRALGMLAGEAFAQLRLEPQGYRRVTLEGRAATDFDLIYVKDHHEPVLIDTRAADEQRETVRGADGRLLERGTRPYIELALANLHKERPELAQQIRTALDAGRLRYFEVRQPIDDEGQLGDIEVRQFAL